MSRIVDYPLGWHAGVVAQRATYGRHVGERTETELRHAAVFGASGTSARWSSWSLEVARLELARREALDA